MVNLIEKITIWCANQSPWQQRGFVFLMGALSVLALAPFYLFPLLFITLPLFLISHDNAQTLKQGFWLGWWFGFGYFTFGLYWIAYALFVDIASFWWVLPFAVMGLPFVLSFFWALASAFLTKLNLSGVSKWLFFAISLSAAEWGRGHIFTGFPWNLLGYVWVKYPALLQSASWVGVYGLTLYTFLECSVLYLVKPDNKGVFKKQVSAIVMIVVTAACLFVGQFRGKMIEHLLPSHTSIRLVQPNIPQKDKWVAQKMSAHFEKLVTLSAQPSSKKLSAIIWPETATAFFDTFAVRQFEASVPEFLKPDQVLITGVLDYGRNDDGDMAAYNRLTVFDDMAEPIQSYDKHHLVPFGEYVPFEKYWPINPIASNGLMFTPGAGVDTLSVGKIPPFSPLICYEVIFPNAVVNAGATRPQWLLNLTNDAWYGYTTGPFQHLAITQMRAVEEGIPLVRAANTGVSAVIDVSGRVIASIPLQETGVIDVTLPSSVPPTLYARFGDWIFFALLILLGGLSMGLRHDD